ncbi:hypothetical protein RLOatenuis_5230 [Rickettsiales bacterium]|nr:hypothetical protein RLOatenuis_5230 [Rickettsiales bacterium]
MLTHLEESITKLESLMDNYIKDTGFLVKRLAKEKKMLEMQLEKQIQDYNALQEVCKLAVKKVNSVISALESVSDKEGAA